jgi:hypothetical protein
VSTPTARPYVRLAAFAVVLLVLLVGAVRWTASRLATRVADAPAALAPAARSSELAREYESAVSRLLREFAAAEAGDSVASAAAAAKLRDDLLTLTVPTEYKDFHLDLVVALSRLTAGYRGDAASLEAGRVMFREATARYQWASSL